MPLPEAILGWATAVANEWRELAVAWHAALAVLGVSLLAGWRPSNRVLGALLTAPLVSVSVLAWRSGNWFNGFLFAAIAGCLLALAARASKNPARISTPRVAAAGALLLGFGWVYPHFVRVTSPIEYAYATPFGLLPCPTLAVIVGMTLVFNTLESRPWGAVTAAAGILYGFIGVIALDVALDYFLVSGAVVLALTLISDPSRSGRDAPGKRRGLPPAPVHRRAA